MYAEAVQLIFFILSYKRVRAELFSAITDVESLIETHKNVTEKIEKYLELEEFRLECLRRYLNFFKKDEKNMKRDDKFALNPINAFSLIHKLTKDVRVIEDDLWINGEPKLSEGLDLPVEEDIDGAAFGLELLQKTYNLNVTQLAAGIITSTFNHGNKLCEEKTSPMTISETFQVGESLFTEGDFESALHWFYEALDKYYHLDMEDPYSGDESNIIDYIRQAYHDMNDFSSAMEWTEILMQLKPTQPGLYEIMVFYRNQLNGNETVIFEELASTLEDSFDEMAKFFKGKILKTEDNRKHLHCFYKNGPSPFLLLAPIKAELLYEDPDVYFYHDTISDAQIESDKSTSSPKDFSKEAAFILSSEDALDKTTKLCRGEVPIKEDKKKRFYCFYKSGPAPFLRLAPIKAELLYEDPDVYLFYDTISDADIAFIRNASLPLLQRSEVGLKGKSKYRISKTGWLHDKESSLVERLSVRVSDFTDLSVETAEDLQVANYGIGGHYAPHYDFFAEGNNGKYGERIATVLFYMSVVEQGGATVFIHSNLTVFPVKNAALFWLNLLPSGEPDYRTYHAACPVLVGSKWASNKWLHEAGQEFIKPCGLEPQENSYLRFRYYNKMDRVYQLDDGST